jgi:hypothetical protein
MPAFTFEKIEPPAPDGPVPAAKAQRGVVVRILDRLVETRLKGRPDEEGADARQKKSPE